jgi:plastocyanin
VEVFIIILGDDHMKNAGLLLAAILVILVIGLLALNPQAPSATTGTAYFTITDARLDLANVTSVQLTMMSVSVHKTASTNCSLSLCDCKCHPEGQTPEETNDVLCGINCLGLYNVSGCKAVGSACKEAYANESAEESGWITVLNTSETFDLMALSGGVEKLITSAQMEPGTYNLIRLYVPNVTVTINNQTQEAKMPSGKIDIAVQFEIIANSSSIALLDFNLNESLHMTGNGMIIMAPVIRVQVDRNATLNIDNGTVHRLKAQKETEKKVGMDENGTTGEDRGIPADVNLTIRDDGRIQRVHEAAGEASAPKTYDITVRASGFDPASLTIKAGDTVRWIFRDVIAHQVYSESGGFNSNARYNGQLWTNTFSTPGTYAYADPLSSPGQNNGTITVE